MLDPKLFTLHSGGANGADSYFGEQGLLYGITNQKHYWYKFKTPYSKWNDKITNEEYLEGCEKVQIANKTLKRKNISKYMHLLSRNYCQVKYSDAVFAISTLNSDKTVNGGTGWGCQMCIDENKPLFVFDQEKNNWYKYSYEFSKFILIYQEDLLILPFNFAGIGTRELNDNGRKAIEKLYNNTFK